MPGLFHFLRCIGKAVVKNGGKALCSLVPFAEVAFEVARDAYEDYRKHRAEADLRADLEGLAQASQAEVRNLAEMVAAQEGAGQPAEVRLVLASYLNQMPASIRQSLRRPSDPGGTTVPPALSLRKPEDLLPFLPTDLPRFKPGDRPLAADWELVELLGKGGFGEVWKARHLTRSRQKPVALKFCLDPVAAATLRNEAALHDLLDRVREEASAPGIVPLLETYLRADPPCLMYEFIEGGDLTGLVHEMQAQDQLTPAFATWIVHRLASIVAVAHRLDPPLVHRDLKMSNVLVRRRDGDLLDLFVADFGIGGLAAGQALREKAGRRVLSSQLLPTAIRGAYTPLYASPQQVQGERPDPRDDVHALGVIWYQLVTGDLRLLSIPPDWRDVVEERGVGEEQVPLLAACIASRAEKRPVDAAELTERLAGYRPGVQQKPGTSGKQHQGQQEQPQWQQEEEERARQRKEKIRCHAQEQRQEQERRKREAQAAERDGQELAERMEQWKRSGMPQEWVLEHLDGWDHPTLLALANRVKSTSFWPLKLDEMAAYLERVHDEIRAKRDGQQPAERRSQKEEVRRLREKEQRQHEQDEEKVRAHRMLENGNEAHGRFGLDDELLAFELGITVQQLRGLSGERAERLWQLSLEQEGQWTKEMWRKGREIVLPLFYFNSGNAWYKKKDYDKAIQDFDEAIRLDLTFTLAYSNRGYVWFAKKDYDKAIKDFDEAIRLDPKCVLAYINRGLAWSYKKEYDKAIQDYDEAIRLDPSNAFAYSNRGVDWLDNQDYDKAIKDFYEAIRLDPKDVAAYINRGLAWSYKKEYDKAIQDYDEAIQLNPKYVTAYTGRGNAWLNKKEYDKAIQDYDEALRLDPKDMVAYINRGLAWSYKKEYDKAIQDCDEAIRLNPKYALAYTDRGNAWLNKKEYDKAIHDYDEAIRLDPTNALAYSNRNLARLRGRENEIVCCSMCGRDTTNKSGICSKCYGHRRYGDEVKGGKARNAKTIDGSPLQDIYEGNQDDPTAFETYHGGSVRDDL